MVVVQKMVLAIFLIILIAGCNSEGENKAGKKDSLETITEKASGKDASDKPRGNKIYLEYNKFKNLSDNEASELKKDGWDVHLKSDFQTDSANFNNTFIKNDTLKNSSSFELPIADLYLDMQVLLDIKADYERDENTNEQVQNRIRIYPALSKEGTTKKLYLLLMGEDTRLNQNNEWEKPKIMAGSNVSFFSINNGTFNQLKTAQDKIIARNDMINFRNFWVDKYGFVDTSYSFSIEKYEKMLKKKHLDIYNWQKDRKAGYGIVLYPCLDSTNKLFFVAKGYEKADKLKNGIIILEDKNFYDNMDVCPKACPENEL